MYYLKMIVWACLGIACSGFTVFADSATSVSGLFQTTDTMRAEAKFTTNLLENLHYAKKPIASLNSPSILRDYIEQFDPYHFFLTEPEIAVFELRFGDTLPFYLKQGNLFPAFEIFAKIREKANKRIDWILNRLDQPFDFNTQDTFTPDRKDSSWPATEAEADFLATQRLQYDLLNEILSTKKSAPLNHVSVKSWRTWPLLYPIIYRSISLPGGWINTLDQADNSIPIEWTYGWKPDVSLTEADRRYLEEAINSKKFQERLLNAKKTLHDRYKRLQENILEFEPVEIEEIFLSTVAHAYDPHSTFFSADSMEDFSIAIRNSLMGIGAVLADEDGYCMIRELIAGSPAAKSKQLKPGDAIVGIAQGSGPVVDVIGMRLKRIVKMIRGAKGTEVRLQIRPGGGDPADRKIVTLIRAEVEITTSLAQAELVTLHTPQGLQKIGVIEIPAFYGAEEDNKLKTSTTTDVNELIKKLREKGATGLILDIRRNGGGLLTEAISLTGLFLTTGPVLQVKDSMGNLNEYIDNDPHVAWEGPLIILVSRYSASASEILAGALKDQNRALIVGDSATHGKGTVQVVLDIDQSSYARGKTERMGSAKVTIQKWYRPSGLSTQLKGVESDIAFPSINPFLPIGESDLPHALAWDAIHPLAWAYDDTFSISNEIKERLTAQSQQRKSTLLELIYFQENVDYFQKKQDEKSISLNLNQRMDQKAADVVFTTSMAQRMNALDPTGFPSEKILLDAALEAQKKEPSVSDEDNNALESSLLDPTHEGLDIHKREALRIMSNFLAEKVG